MKIKINKSGHLEIERAGTMRGQYCPHQEDDPCGDWCPLFRELLDFGCPQSRSVGGFLLEGQLEMKSKGFKIVLCNVIHYVSNEDFTDERKRNTKSGSDRS